MNKIIITYANTGNSQFLHELVTEKKTITNLFQSSNIEKYIIPKNCDDCKIDDLYSKLLEHQKELSIFHFAGHAHGNVLQLENQDANKRGIAELLSQCVNLKLVFLNGCVTKGHIETLFRNGIKIVIATTASIDDNLAREFATKFYEALTQDRTIEDSFNYAVSFIHASNNQKDVRTYNFRDFKQIEKSKNDDFPWGLYSNENSESSLKWKIKQPKIKQETFTTEDEYYIPKTVSTNSFGSNFFNVGESLIDIIKNNKADKIVLLAAGGSGKSFELVYTAKELQNYGYYPYYIELKNFGTGDIINELKDLETVQIYYTPIVILDGYDELTDKETFRKLLEKFVNNNPKIKIVISARTNFYKKDIFLGFQPYHLDPLHYKHVDNYLKSKNIEPNNFKNQLYNNSLLDFIDSPFFLTKIVRYFIEKGIIPQSRTEFFDGIINDKVKKDAVRDDISTTTSIIKEQQLQLLLEKTAFVMLLASEYSLSENELLEISGSEKNLKLLQKSLLWKNSDDKTKNYQFQHVFFAEFLAAKVFQKISIKEIFKIISISKKNKKINTVWINTLSVLIDILEKSKSNELINYIEKNDKEILVGFEKHSISDNTRIKIFKKIFLRYKNEKRAVNWGKYSYRKLIWFAKQPQLITFLTKQLHSEINEQVRLSATYFLLYYPLNEIQENQKVEIKRHLQSNLDNDVLRPVTINCLAHLQLLDIAEFTEIVNKYLYSDNKNVRLAVYQSINELEFQEEFIGKILEAILKHSERNSEFEDIYLNEVSELKEAITKIKSEKGILQVIRFYKKKYENIGHNKLDEIKTIIKYAAKSYPKNKEIYKEIKAFLTHNVISLFQDIPILIEYFKISKQEQKAFKEIFYENKNQLQKINIITSLEKLADKDTIDFVANEFVKGNIAKGFIDSFQHRITNETILKDFNTKINTKEKIELPVKYDYKAEQKIKIEKSVTLLFDKEKFICEIARFFKEEGNDNITYEQYWNFYKITQREKKFNSVIIDALWFNDKNRTINKFETIDKINRDWTKYYAITQIYNFLINKGKEIQLNDAQIKFIKDWCDLQAKNIDFKNSLFHPNGDIYSTSSDWKTKYFSFFIRKFNFSHYPKELYLSMLSYVKWDGFEQGIFSFVESVINNKSIVRTRVIENLKQGIDFDMFFSNHIKFCTENNVTEVCEFLLPYLKNKTAYQRREVIGLYKSLNCPVENLIQLLPEIKDSFKFDIFNMLIKKGHSQKVVPFLQKILKTESEDEKYKAALLLIECQNINGLRYLISHIKKTKTVELDGTFNNPLYFLKTRKAIPYILKLYKLSFNKNIKQDKVWHNLENMTVTALENITLHKSNFLKVNKQIKLFLFYCSLICFSGSQKQIVSNMKYYWEIIEQKNYNKYNKTYSIAEAISFFDSKLNLVNSKRYSK